ncbi:BnaC07g48000D [Brassica napus]|uniref:BnaC07g48000D protein n=1 Tax=Brassica napus TaxID=3708 RepID=A0A078JF56_BRANA|nr:BnaC07g48000D [Brassica napus]
MERRRRRDRATTATRSSDDGDVECILSHARSRRDRVTTARSSKNHKLTTAILTTAASLTKTTRKEELCHFLMQRRVLTQGEDLWFTFSDQPMRFSLREFHLTTGLRCEEDQTITVPQFKIMKKPYLWMLGKNDKFTVRTLYEMFTEKARSMPTLERLSLGTSIITEAVIIAENLSSKIPRDRLQHYMNYRLPKMAWGKTAYSILMRSVKSLSASSWTRDSYEVSGFALAINLWAMSSVNVLGKSLGKPCKISSSSDPLCLHWDSTRTPTITEVLELEKINNVEVSTVIRLAEEYKHLVGAIHSDDADFHSVVKLVQQGYKMRRSDWEKGFVDMFVATEDIGQQRKTKDEDAEHGEDLNHSEDEEENKDEEEKTDEEENKDEEYQKEKEQRKDKDHSMSNSEKLDKLIQMVLLIKFHVLFLSNDFTRFFFNFNDGSPNKEDCENGASSVHKITKMKKIQLMKKQTLVIKKMHQMMKMKKIQLLKKQTLGMEEVTSPTPTFNTPNFDTRFHRLLQHLRLLSLISFPKKVIVERVLMRDVCEIPVFQPLMKIKKRLVQQDSQVNEDVEPPLQKKFKADTDNVPLRRSERTDLFLNKTALVVGVKFLEEIDELYDEFLDDKKVNVEKRSITAFNCAAMKFTDASFVPYVNAYAMALPFMIRNFFKDVSMDTSKFSIKIVLKIEDSGVYALKLIECHGIRIMDLTKLSEEKNAIIREKLAVDIFSELQ